VLPFASINPTNQRTNLWNFLEIFLRIVVFENLSFFESAILNFFFKKKFFFCFIPIKISPNLYGRLNWSKFCCFPWFPENSLLCVILRYTVYTVHLLTTSIYWVVKVHWFHCISNVYICSVEEDIIDYVSK
jgi:hypothetical protein